MSSAVTLVLLRKSYIGGGSASGAAGGAVRGPCLAHLSTVPHKSTILAMISSLLGIVLSWHCRLSCVYSSGTSALSVLYFAAPVGARIAGKIPK